MNPTLIAAGAFIAIALAVYLVGRVIVGSRRNRPGDTSRPLALGPLTWPFAAALPKLVDAELPKDLRRAGLYHPRAMQEYLAIRNALVLGWGAVCAAAYALIFRHDPDWIILFSAFAVVVLVIFYSVPRLLLQAQASM